MSATGNIKVTLYKPWMNSQLVRMICQEYGLREEQQDRLMKDFYEHPYQREKSIRITALDGEKVVGFQSFFYWPYLLDGKIVNAYQSGNSIVDPNYRGRGIFNRLLNYLDEIREDKQVDLLIGFPRAESYKSFIRNGWSNVLNLNWYVKIISPLSIIIKFNHSKLALNNISECLPDILDRKGFTLKCCNEFGSWRKNYSMDNGYFYFHYEDGSCRLQFDLKINLRGRLKELIVGRVRTNCDDLDFLKKAVTALYRKVSRFHVFTFISIALNERYFKPEILMAFRQSGFRRIKKEIFFIIKDYKLGESAYKPELWELYRSDIDTW